MTVGRSSVGIRMEGGSSSLTLFMAPFFLLSVDRLLMGRLGAALLSRLSVLPWTERGGVRGEGRCCRSVGRSAAGVYMGDLGWRNWRLARGKSKVLPGEVGEAFAEGCEVGFMGAY